MARTRGHHLALRDNLKRNHEALGRERGRHPGEEVAARLARDDAHRPCLVCVCVCVCVRACVWEVVLPRHIARHSAPRLPTPAHRNNLISDHQRRPVRDENADKTPGMISRDLLSVTREAQHFPRLVHWDRDTSPPINLEPRLIQPCN